MSSEGIPFGTLNNMMSVLGWKPGNGHVKGGDITTVTFAEYTQGPFLFDHHHSRGSAI